MHIRLLTQPRLDIQILQSRAMSWRFCRSSSYVASLAVLSQHHSNTRTVPHCIFWRSWHKLRYQLYHCHSRGERIPAAGAREPRLASSEGSPRCPAISWPLPCSSLLPAKLVIPAGNIKTLYQLATQDRPLRVTVSLIWSFFLESGGAADEVDRLHAILRWQLVEQSNCRHACRWYWTCRREALWSEACTPRAPSRR